MHRNPVEVIADVAIYTLFVLLISPLVIGFINWFLRALDRP
jgi:hypothetical protein